MTKTSMYKHKADYRRIVREENAEWFKLAELFDIVDETPTEVSEPEYDITCFAGLIHFINSSYDLCNDENVADFMFFPKIRERHPVKPNSRHSNEENFPGYWGVYYRAAARYHRNRLAPVKKFVATIIAAKKAQMSN